MNALELGLDMLRGADNRHITVKQVVYLGSMYCRETQEQSAFRSPDYTIVMYNGTGDGWECFRMANGAGILKLISHAKVLESRRRRNRELKIDEYCRRINEAFDAGDMAAIEVARAEYRTFLEENPA
jgi:hypothetical protein